MAEGQLSPSPASRVGAPERDPIVGGGSGIDPPKEQQARQQTTGSFSPQPVRCRSDSRGPGLRQTAWHRPRVCRRALGQCPLVHRVPQSPDLPGMRLPKRLLQQARVQSRVVRQCLSRRRRRRQQPRHHRRHQSAGPVLVSRVDANQPHRAQGRSGSFGTWPATHEANLDASPGLLQHGSHRRRSAAAPTRTTQGPTQGHRHSSMKTRGPARPAGWHEVEGEASMFPWLTGNRGGP